MDVKPGEKFTVAGVGYDAEGWLIVGGVRIDGTPSKAETNLVWTMGETAPVS